MAQDLLKKKKAKESAANLSKLKGEFEQIQSTPLTRTVILKADCWCGFGCNEARVERVVPYDSPLKDGDSIGKDIKKTDKTFLASDRKK